MSRVKIFIDFRNFQLDWNRIVGNDPKGQRIPIPWKDLLPSVLCNAVKTKVMEDVKYVGTHVYASVNKEGDEGLRKFLHAMDGFPGYSVTVKDRKANSRKIRCKNDKCKHQIGTCPKCNEPLNRTVEKGIDAALLTDMIQFAVDNVYDIGVLGSTDADFCGAVKLVNDRMGKPTYNLWFDGGHNLRNACFDHFIMKDLLHQLGVP